MGGGQESTAVPPWARSKPTGGWGGAGRKVLERAGQGLIWGRAGVWGGNNRSIDFRLLSLHFLICEMELRRPIL